MKRIFSANEVPREQVEIAMAELKRDAVLRFSDEALLEAQRAAQRSLPQLPDFRQLPLVTIDPVGARDLDQAMYLERSDAGYTVYYAIAAVSLFVAPGGALDQAVHQRGVTVYLPDRAIPLHPLVLSAGAASLLPAQDRPAYLWRIELNAAGEIERAHVQLAMVR